MPIRRTAIPLARPAAATLLALVVTLGAGCDRKSEAELLAAADAALARGEPRVALIELRNALQKNERSGAARLLLGRALLASGDPAGAVLELRKALDQNAPRSKVLPLLGQAMLAAGEAKELVEMFRNESLDDPGAHAEVKSLLAAGLATLRRNDEALEVVEQALKGAPENASALLVKARLLVAANDVAGARAIVDQIVERDARNVAAVQLQADLMVVQGEPPAGIAESYRKALALDPTDFAARAGLVSVLMQLRDLKQAEAELQTLLKQHPDQARAKLLQARLLLEQRDFAAAREIAQLLLKNAPENARLNELAGAIEAGDGALVKAEFYLSKAVQLDAELPIARRLLVRTWLRSGQPAKALTLLQTQLARDDAGVEVLGLAAEAQQQLGNPKAAEALYLRAGKVAPDDERVVIGLALSRLAQSRNDDGLHDLEKVAEGSPSPAADLALIDVLVARGRLDPALQAIERLEAKDGAQALGAVLRARVLLLKRDDSGARAAYERALTVDKAYYPATAGLVALDLRAGQADAARQRLQAVLQADPGHYQALLALAKLQDRSGGNRDEAGKLVAAAIKSRPQAAAARVAQIDQLLAARDAKGALSAAEEASAVLPDDPRVLDALGRAQLASGSAQQALSTFRKLIAIDKRSPTPWVRLANVQVALDERKAAADSLRQALVLKPKLLEAQRGLVQLAAADRDWGAALAGSREVQQQRPTEPAGWVLEGDVLAVQGRWDSAVEAYQRALKLAPTGELAIKTHAALLGAKRGDDAGRFAESWPREHPKDTLFLIHLGDRALGERDLAGAEARYRQAVDIRGDDAQALNNLASVLAAQKKPGAVALAEKANQLHPDSAPMLDTLASAQAAEGQLPKAVQTQRRALSLERDNLAIRYNLARLLIQAGEKTEARSELETVAKAGKRFPGQDEVKSLLKTL